MDCNPILLARNHPKHLNNAKWQPWYKSAHGFGPRNYSLPAAILLDLENIDPISQLTGYEAVVQNLRLLKRPGINVWSMQDKKWSEAAGRLELMEFWRGLSAVFLAFEQNRVPPAVGIDETGRYIILR